MADLWNQLVHAVCRPYRIEYERADLPGGARGQLVRGSLIVQRQDFVITNTRDERLECSLWEPKGAGAGGPLPAVVYCHANSGSRLDAQEAIVPLLPLGIRVFALDFSGSGISDGEYVTLGANEVDDLAALVAFIRAGGHTTGLALWGRSMGAVTALLYSERDPSVAGIVLDSPFSRLVDLMKELAEQQRVPLWRMLGGTALKLMRRSVKKKAGFDIHDIAPLDTAPHAFCPALFGHARDDTFVGCHHTEALHAAYGGDKELHVFADCDHNSPRPRTWYFAACSFLLRALRLSSAENAAGHAVAGLDRDTGQTHSVAAFATAGAGDAGDFEGMPALGGSGAGDLGDEDEGERALQAAVLASLADLRLAAPSESGGAANSGPPAQMGDAEAELRAIEATDVAAAAADDDAMLQEAMRLSLQEMKRQELARRRPAGPAAGGADPPCASAIDAPAAPAGERTEDAAPAGALSAPPPLTPDAGSPTCPAHEPVSVVSAATPGADSEQLGANERFAEREL